jgi:amino acid transporter
VSAAPATAGPRPGRGLRRELRFWEAIALSIGIMAPTAAMALNGVVPAGLVGRAVPLVFLIATIGVLFVAYAFVRLSRYFAHAGSVYAFAGVTLGPRAGFFSGWALLGTYLAFTTASTAEIGLFFGNFLDGVGIWKHPSWPVIALLAGIVIWLVAYGDVRVITRLLLSLEGISVSLITILVVVIFVKVIGGGAPGNQSFTFSVFSVPSGVSLSTVAFATVFAFLSFGGFEGAASLGEETNEPRINIPKAIAAAVLAAGVFYVICIWAQTLGFGTGAKGTAAFAGSSSPLGDLSHSYISSSWADLINLGAAVSAFASALGTSVGASRMLFAFGRDGFGPPALGTTSARTGAPAVGLAVVMVIALVAIAAMRANGTNSVNAFFYPGTIGVLSMIVAYFMTNIGAIRFLHLGRRVPMWEVVIPLVALVFLSYVFYKQVYPVPAYPYDVFPYVVGIWLAVALVVILAFPRLAHRIGASLSREAGLEEAPA